MMLNTQEKKITKGMRFIYAFQGTDVLWEVGDSLGANRRACSIVNGTFMGVRYDSIFSGQEAAFDEHHILACVAMDTQLVRVVDQLDRITRETDNGQSE